MPHANFTFGVRTFLLKSATNFKSLKDRLSLLAVKCANKMFTLIKAHDSTSDNNNKNKHNPDQMESFRKLLDERRAEVHKHRVNILMETPMLNLVSVKYSIEVMNVNVKKSVSVYSGHYISTIMLKDKHV